VSEAKISRKGSPISAAPVPALGPEVQEYAHIWSVCLAAAQQAIPGSACEVLTQAPPETASGDSQDLWITAISQGKPAGSITFRISGKAAANSSAGSETGELTVQNKTALLDCIRRTVEGVRERAPRRLQDEFLVELRDTTPTAKTVAFWLELRGDGSDPIAIEVWFDEVLVQRLQSRNEMHAPSCEAFAESGTKLGMLMDVELVVTVRFGGRRMLLKDILDLCAGSVVELDQQVQEPVDLLLDGKLIARGEVVVVDGNYGLRVSEILSRPER
jgi:flagellar motor switch protein FliN